MAASQEVLPQDLPSDLFGKQESTKVAKDPHSLSTNAVDPNITWCDLLEKWTDLALHAGQQDLFNDAMPLLEKTMLNCALKYTDGHKQEAARLLGWGRNTLTRKLKELGIEK